MTMLVARLSCLRSIPLAGLRPALNQGSTFLRSPILKTYSPLLRTQQQGHSSKSGKGFGGWKMPRRFLEDRKLDLEEMDIFYANSCRKVAIAVSIYIVGSSWYLALGWDLRMEAYQESPFWPQYVTDRINSTYTYVAGSLGLSLLSLAAVSSVPSLMALMIRESWRTVGASLAAVFGGGWLVSSISYEHNTVFKQLAWMLHSGMVGAFCAPLTLLGRYRGIRTILIVSGFLGGMSMIGMCAQNEEVLIWHGLLNALGLTMITSCTGQLYMPQHNIFSSGLYSIGVYALLLMFSLSLWYGMEEVVKHAETYPRKGVEKYDPINACMGIYLNALNPYPTLVKIFGKEDDDDDDDDDDEEDDDDVSIDNSRRI